MSMIEVNTAELEGSALDWAVAYYHNGEPVFFEAFGARMLGRSITAEVLAGNIRPSTDWTQSGPLIIGCRVSIIYQDDDSLPCAWTDETCAYSAVTPLIAVCRAIVAAKHGARVSVPSRMVRA